MHPLNLLLMNLLLTPVRVWRAVTGAAVKLWCEIRLQHTVSILIAIPGIALLGIVIILAPSPWTPMKGDVYNIAIPLGFASIFVAYVCDVVLERTTMPIENDVADDATLEEDTLGHRRPHPAPERTHSPPPPTRVVSGDVAPRPQFLDDQDPEPR